MVVWGVQGSEAPLPLGKRSVGIRWPAAGPGAAPLGAALNGSPRPGRGHQVGQEAERGGQLGQEEEERQRARQASPRLNKIEKTEKGTRRGRGRWVVNKPNAPIQSLVVFLN
jgi:hypothetical protein